MAKYITKSKVLSGIRCPKKLWIQTYKPELAIHSATSELNISKGIEIGSLARRNYPDGILVEHVDRPDLAVAETKTLMKSTDVPIFEAAFLYEDCFIRADIMVPTETCWRMIEVKSSGGVKDHYLSDCAIQVWVAQKAGVKIEQIVVAHVDTSFVYAGDGKYDGLLVEENVTETVNELLPEVPAWLANHRDILKNPIPQTRMRSHCKECDFKELCESEQTEYPLSILPNGRKVIAELQDAGFEDVRNIPVGLLTNDRHIKVWQSTCTNLPIISPILKTEFEKLPYPQFYLDFETINFAIPRWAGTRPHQQLPFQWSCHIYRQSGELEHREFLDTSGIAPMRAFAESLIRAVENDGPIIVYGTFESTVLKTLIEFCPDLEVPKNNIIDRLVNLLPWLQNHYYHPAMKGSWSIKAVLPTVAPHLA
jgi:CRISPR/Cas system-associated exonuclease Cas4 (RecB family)